MPKQYMIEHGKENKRWLYKIERGGRGQTAGRTCCYKPGAADAIRYTKIKEAVSFAQEWRARVWEISKGLPVRQVWPT